MTWGLFGAVLIMCASAFLLRNLGWRGAPVFAVVCAALILNECRGALEGVTGVLSALGESSGMGKSLSGVLKILGLGYLFGISADLCREMGESAIARAVEIFGRIEIIAVTLPFLEEIIKIGASLIE